MFIRSLLATVAALTVAVPTIAVAQEAQPDHVRIIVDNSGECGSYRYAMHRRQDNERTAQRLAAKYEARGIKTDVVIVNPGQVIGAASPRTGNWAPVVSLYC